MTATSLGRRILIHRDCFRAAGDLCPDARGEIAFTMWGMRIIKMVRHHLVDDADLLGLGRPPVVDAALDCLTETFWPPVSGLLRRSVIAPARNRHEGPPVLEPDEAVHASCFFDGYYTFATGTVASAEMLSDTRSIVEVRSASLGQGQTPLTLVRGNRLRCAPEIFGHSDQDAASTSIRATFAEFAAELRAVGDGHWADVTDTCLQLTDRMLAADPF